MKLSIKSLLVALFLFTLYACFPVLPTVSAEGDTCGVTFDMQDGSEPQTVSVQVNATIEEPPVPVREDYTFHGWYLSPVGAGYIDPWDFTSSVTSDITLYAYWTHNESPGKVTGFRVLQAYDNCALLTWDPVPGADEYTVDAPCGELIRVSGTTAWLRDIWGGYTSYVAAWNEYGAGLQSEPLQIVTPDSPTGPPDRVETVRIISNDWDNFLLQFSPVTNSQRYELVYSTTPDMAICERMGVGSGQVQSFYTVDLSYNLSPDTLYYFVIYAINQNMLEDRLDYSSPSDIVSSTTLPATEPPPSDAQMIWYDEPNISGPDWLRMGWYYGNVWGNVSSFHLYYSESPDMLGAQMVSIPIVAFWRMDYTLVGLKPSTTYYLQLIPCNSMGAGGIPSEIKSMTTLSAPAKSGTLAGVTLSAGSLSVPFDPEVLDYSITLTDSNPTVTLTTLLADSSDTITINGKKVSAITVEVKEKTTDAQIMLMNQSSHDVIYVKEGKSRNIQIVVKSGGKVKTRYTFEVSAE